MNENDLRQMIAREYTRILNEQAEDENSAGDEPDASSAVSVDEQIDRLLMQYEKLSLPDEEDQLLEMIKSASLQFILEQDEEEPAEEEPAEEEEDEADPGEVEDQEDSTEIDLATFAAKVARLAEMPEKVLDLKSAIINRAIQYLAANYDRSVASQFEAALMDKFQLAVPEEEVETVVASDLPPPPAAGAGPGGGAGG
jgi:hypothetical protein